MAYAPTNPSRRVTARTREVVDYHYDDSKPGKPLRLLIPGGLLAITSFVALALVGYGEWVEGGISSPEGQLWAALLLIPYFGGLFLFFYGYHLYDWGRALKWTLIAGVAGITILAVGWAVLRALGGAAAAGGAAAGKGSSGSSSSGSSKSSSSSSSSSWFGSGGSTAFGGGGSSSGSGTLSPSLGRGVVRGIGQMLDSYDGPISLNLSGSPNPGPHPGRIVECPVCGYALPGGAGTPCAYCASHVAADPAAASKAGAGMIPCPKCGQPVLPGDRSGCPHVARPAGLPG